MGNLAQALTLLQQTKFEDIYHKISKRVTLAKVFFDLKEWAVLRSHLKALEVFAQRKYKGGTVYQSVLDFALLANRMLRLNSLDNTDKRRLVQAIKDKTSLVERRWLLECLNKLP